MIVSKTYNILLTMECSPPCLIIARRVVVCHADVGSINCALYRDNLAREMANISSRRCGRTLTELQIRSCFDNRSTEYIE